MPFIVVGKNSLIVFHFTFFTSCSVHSSPSFCRIAWTTNYKRKPVLPNCAIEKNMRHFFRKLMSTWMTCWTIENDLFLPFRRIRRPHKDETHFFCDFKSVFFFQHFLLQFYRLSFLRICDWISKVFSDIFFTFILPDRGQWTTLITKRRRIPAFVNSATQNKIMKVRICFYDRKNHFNLPCVHFYQFEWKFTLLFIILWLFCFGKKRHQRTSSSYRFCWSSHAK